jgi:hypothetical protein
VRTCDASFIVDPGHAMDPSAGTRRVVPALAELGIRKLDAVVVSKTRLACVSAIPEVVEALSPRAIVVRSTESTATENISAPDEPRRGAWAAVLAHAREAGVHIVRPSLGRVPSQVDTTVRRVEALAAATVGPDDAERELLERSSAVRTIHAPNGTATIFTWTDHGWRPADTTIARRSSTQSPAMLPSSDSMTSSNGASGREGKKCEGPSRPASGGGRSFCDRPTPVTSRGRPWPSPNDMRRGYRASRGRSRLA